MKVLIDTNVVLDVLLDRQPFSGAALSIFALVEKPKIEGFLCATTVTTVDYLLGQALTAADARRALQKLFDLFEIAPVNRPVLERALRSRIADFEDAVIEQAAKSAGVDAIVTRNGKDFRKSSVPVFDPAELLSAFRTRKDSKSGLSGKPRGKE